MSPVSFSADLYGSVPRDRIWSVQGVVPSGSHPTRSISISVRPWLCPRETPRDSSSRDRGRCSSLRQCACARRSHRRQEVQAGLSRAGSGARRTSAPERRWGEASHSVGESPGVGEVALRTLRSPSVEARARDPWYVQPCECRWGTRTASRHP